MAHSVMVLGRDLMPCLCCGFAVIFAIFTKLCLVFFYCFCRDFLLSLIDDVIIHSNFGFNIFRGFRSTGGQNFRYHIDFAVISINFAKFLPHVLICGPHTGGRITHCIASVRTVRRSVLPSNACAEAAEPRPIRRKRSDLESAQFGEYGDYVISPIITTRQSRSVVQTPCQVRRKMRSKCGNVIWNLYEICIIILSAVGSTHCLVLIDWPAWFRQYC